MVRGKPAEFDPNAKPKPAPKPAKADKTDKPAAKVKEPKAENPKAQPGDNKKKLEGDEQRRAFLQFNQQIMHLRGKVQLEQDKLDEALTSAKAAGFLKKDFDIARDLNDKKKPKKVSDDITRRLRIANWLGHPLGKQADLFASPEPDRTPVVDRAYDEGKQASMEGKSPSPPYDPGHPAYQAYMNGYHDDQKRLGNQFKKLDAATDGASAPVAAAAPALVPAGGDDDFEDEDDESFDD